MKEMGGYLPLELCRGKEHYQFEKDKMLRVNCGRAAIHAALIQFRPKRVILPYFICPTVKSLVKEAGIPFSEYSIGEDFFPKDIQCNEDDCVVLVNYFGLVNRKELALKLAGETRVLLDNTQAFYAEPIFHPNILNVYSCRKFFGVSDGGYLIGEHLQQIDLQPSESWRDSLFLTKSLELGTNAAYILKKECEERLGTMYTQMSALTKGIMDGIDYLDVAKRRRENFKTLNGLMGRFNELQWDLEPSSVPYMYPFMIRREIREELLLSKIYIPILWKESACGRNSYIIENNFSRWIYHLPIDQRYTDEDMQYLANVIQEKLKV